MPQSKNHSLILDIETDGLLESCTKIWCISTKRLDDGSTCDYWPYTATERELKDMFLYLGSFERLIIHNGIDFDLPVIKKIYGWEYTGEVLDTLIQSRMQDPNRPLPKEAKQLGVGPHSLASWGYRVGRGKVEHENWQEYSKEMLHRCREDVEILHLVYKELMIEAAEQDWMNPVRMTCRLFSNLKKMEDNGFTVDREQLDKSLAALNRWMGRIETALEPYLPVVMEPLESKSKGKYNFIKKPFLKSGEPAKATKDYFGEDASNVGGQFCRVQFRKVSLDKADEVKSFLLSKGWEPQEKTPTGKPKLTKDEKFYGLKDKTGKLAAKYVQCKQRRGIVEGWEKSIRPDGKIGPKVSGLTVTYRARHKGIVNVPRPSSFFGGWMRKIFIPRKGWVLVGTDAEGCQIRMLAARMEDKAYIDVVCNTDVHTYHKDKADIVSREKAKEFFYAMQFGASDKKLGQVLNKTTAVGRDKRNKLMAGLPAMDKVIKGLRAEWEESATLAWNKKFNKLELANGFIKGADGRRVYSSSPHTILVNTVQADEAILMAIAVNMLHKWLDKEGLVYGVDYAMVLWYHDEIQMECKPECADIVAKKGREAIKWAGKFLGLACPQTGDSKVGKHWGETH